MKQTEQIGKIKQYFQKNKNYYFIGAGLLLAFAIGLSINCGTAKKVAMVDVQKIVNSSAAVNALKVEHQGKMAELQTWLSNAEISEDITKIANEKGYNLILVKGMVISGADDITEYVIEGVR